MVTMEHDLRQLTQDIVETVTKHWNEHRQPLLLSALGNLEGGRISRDARLHADGLRQFLEEFASDGLEIVEHSANRTIVGVVPIDEHTRKTEDWDSLLENTSSRSAKLRLHPAFWAAFRNPIDDSLERYLQISDSIKFVDAKSEEAPEDGIQVRHEYIASPGTSPARIYESAMRWIKENGLDVSDIRRKAPDGLPPKDLLGQLILALDPQDLERTTIPMDVVAKLRRQPA